MILEKPFTKIANRVAYATGTPIAFVVCCLVVVVWAVTGPIFDYSDTWQLIINTGTTIVTFLMVFLIQNTQNRDGAATKEAEMLPWYRKPSYKGKMSEAEKRH